MSASSGAPSGRVEPRCRATVTQFLRGRRIVGTAHRPTRPARWFVRIPRFDGTRTGSDAGRAVTDVTLCSRRRRAAPGSRQEVVDAPGTRVDPRPGRGVPAGHVAAGEHGRARLRGPVRL